MSQYLVLSHIKVQNANCIAGFTWGYPSVTNFLGFTHAMQRKLSVDYDIEFAGCAIVSNDFQQRVHKPNPRGDFEFIQSRNPPVLAIHKSKSSAPIIEEGKIDLTTSVIIELSKELIGTDDKIEKFKQNALEICLKIRLAGGTILSVGRADLLSSSTDEQSSKLNHKIRRLTMPGFVLKDRSEYLNKHFKQLQENDPEVELLDAWLDFSAMKFQAKPTLENKDNQASLETEANWSQLPKPEKGWLVPIMTGYKAISECYSAGEVDNTRDNNTTCCFVEALHSIGEWRSMHRTVNIHDLIWKYQYKDEWYLCVQRSNGNPIEEQLINHIESNNYEAAISNL